MGRGIVRMKGNTGLWTSGMYSMQHLGGGGGGGGGALMHIPVCGHSAPFLQWNSCDVSGFGNVRGNHPFTGAPRSFEF